MKILIKLILIFLVILGAFYFGVKFHTMLLSYYYSGKIKVNKLTCIALNDLFDSYQNNCYYPQTKQFKYSNSLKCKMLTNTTLNKNFDTSNPTNNIELVTAKADYLSFNLQVNEVEKTVRILNMPNDELHLFNIFSNEKQILFATANKTWSEPAHHTTTQYSLNFSKSTGFGALTKHDEITSEPSIGYNSITTDYFSCENTL